MLCVLNIDVEDRCPLATEYETDLQGVPNEIIDELGGVKNV